MLNLGERVVTSLEERGPKVVPGGYPNEGEAKRHRGWKRVTTKYERERYRMPKKKEFQRGACLCRSSIPSSG